jgi:uncharacterized circularly permuted ATP-grasp superfamily protein/uncharacterized alpha-E superfamily protein
MQTTPPPDLADSQGQRLGGIEKGYLLHSDLSDEMAGADGSLRSHWRPFVSMLNELGPKELRQRWDQARRLIHENGVTHNVYGDPNGLDRPWSLDLIPLLISQQEWNRISEGLIQRAHLLDRLLADLYGPAHVLTERLLPPELVWANLGFLRPCHGIEPPGNHWLHLYAADLVRSSDGNYEVLSDRTQAPSGAGYSLENRIVLSRVLPSMFRQCNVQRLAPFFRTLRNSLSSLAAGTSGSPRIVLMTPGPYNETYFEHSFLARYLGYPLVQGNDLTVRDAKVYLKTLGGLERVDVILRRVDDEYCDPLELFAPSHLGVPGLLQSIRLGNVAVANALGVGLLQAPGFLPFLPAICRRLLGEELKLPSVATWWCGQAAELRYVLDHLPEMVIKSAYPTRGADPVFAQSLTRSETAELAEKIKTHPEQYVAQHEAMCCTTPALIENQLQPRRFVVRSYLAADGDTYAVMQGALTRITQSRESLVVSLQRGGGNKDTWILSDEPVSQVTLLPSSGQPVALTRGGEDLPSRVADDLFWLGRCVERAESQVRLARVTFARIIDQSGAENGHAIKTLMEAWSEKLTPVEGHDPATHFISGALGDVDSGGLRSVITYIHGLARILRDRISVDAWRILQEAHQTVSTFELGVRNPAVNVPELLDSLIETFAAFVGLASDSMTHGLAWKFLDLGRRIERATFVGRLLRETLVKAGQDGSLLEAILEITDCSLTYRRRYLTNLEPHAIADLLVADELNPRSIAFQFGVIKEHLAALPRDEARPNNSLDHRILLKIRTSIQLADLSEICIVPTGQELDGLHALLSYILDQTCLLSDSIARLYFSHAAISRELGDSREESAT